MPVAHLLRLILKLSSYTFDRSYFTAAIFALIPASELIILAFE